MDVDYIGEVTYNITTLERILNNLDVMSKRGYICSMDNGDEVVRAATFFHLERIGESCQYLSESIRKKDSSIEWDRIEYVAYCILKDFRSVPGEQAASIIFDQLPLVRRILLIERGHLPNRSNFFGGMER